MSVTLRTTGCLALLVACSSVGRGATPQEIDAAIKKGADSLKARYAKAGGAGGADDGGGYGIGPTCLSGLALLEAGVPPTDPALKNITSHVRNAAYRQTRTYQVSLCLMYLDRLGEPGDVPLIQALAVRLLVSQSAGGGWGYDTISSVPQADVQRLQAIKPGPAGKFHPDVEEYARALVAQRAKGNTPGVGDDNSNTQFAVMAVWMARKHGVPVDSALDLIERRYIASQTRTGGWPYSGPAANGGGPPGGAEMAGSPSMYCAGLIGLATGVARQEEKHKAREEKKPRPDPKKDPPKKSDDPFFNPPPKEGKEPPRKKKPTRPLTATDRAVQGGLAGLGVHVARSAQAGRGGLALDRAGHGRHDLYFFWSLERVGVIFGVEKIGGVDWYEAGAQTLVHSQSPDGSWSGSYNREVDTAFAILFLCRSNLARDLSGKVQKETGTEMKAGIIPGIDPQPGTPTAGGNPDPAAPPLVLPGATGSQAAILVGELLRAPEKDWSKVLAKLRDTKGSVHTQALLGAVARVQGAQRKAVREALAERLTRMTADTLREMAKYDDVELRRAAILAMAMKDDKAHIPDLVAAILDEEDMVVRAARAGLKSLTGEDFGPDANATAGEKLFTVDSWKKWMAKEQK